MAQRFNGPLKSSPTKPNAFRPRDPARNPEPPQTTVQPSAPKDRQNQIMDAIGTTIIMPMRQFQEDIIPIPPDFDNVFHKERIRNLSRILRQACKDAANAKGIGGPEKKITAGWAKANNSVYGPLCPGYIFHLSENTPQPGDENRYKVDMSLIPEEYADEIRPKVPNWWLQGFSGEFKPKGRKYDAFARGVDEPIQDEVARSEYRGQAMSYAGHIFYYQHRTAFFMLFVNGDMFRVMRWDRSGVIVSEAKDYVSDLNKTRVLLQILHGFSKLSPEQRGIDPTVKRLSPDSCGWKRMDALALPQSCDLEAKQADYNRNNPAICDFLAPFDPEALFTAEHIHRDPAAPCDHCTPSTAPPRSLVRAVFSFVRALFRESLDENYPRYQITMSTGQFLVAKPNFKAFGMIGRGTRGYVALEWSTQRFTFLKDTWRPYYEGVDAEGSILDFLNSLHVSYIPKLICHGDVLNQETETSRYSPDAQPRKTVRPPTDSPTVQGKDLRHLIHHRTVAEDVCLPSSAFENGQHLLTVVYQALQAHKDASTKGEIIHRDISAGNILICPIIVFEEDLCTVQLDGMLSDWELGKNMNVVKALQPHRTGTWAFMSAQSLLIPNWLLGIADELESFVHVLVYLAIRFLPSSLSELAAFMDGYFDGHMLRADSNPTCPAIKYICVFNDGELHHIQEPIIFYQSHDEDDHTRHVLQIFFAKVFKVLKARYMVLKADGLTRVVNPLNHDPTPAVPSRPIKIQPFNPFWNKRRAQRPPPVTVDKRRDDSIEDQAAAEAALAKSRETAKLLDNYDFMEKLIEELTSDSVWPADDKGPDRLKEENYAGPRQVQALTKAVHRSTHATGNPGTGPHKSGSKRNVQDAGLPGGSEDRRVKRPNVM